MNYIIGKNGVAITFGIKHAHMLDEKSILIVYDRSSLSMWGGDDRVRLDFETEEAAQCALNKIIDSTIPKIRAKATPGAAS